MSTNIQAMAQMAIFMDFTASAESFEVELITTKLRQKGRLLIQKAYANATRYTELKKEMAENGVELVELPFFEAQNPCHAAIRLTVDVLETAFTHSHIDTYLLCIGHQDYTALFSKLRSLNKRIILISEFSENHHIWKKYCDEVVDYESFVGNTSPNISPNISHSSHSNNPNRIAGRSLSVVLRKAISDLSTQSKPVYDWQIKAYLENADAQFRVENYGVGSWEGLWEKAQKDTVIDCTETAEGLEIALTNLITTQEVKLQGIAATLPLFYEAALTCPVFDHNKISLSDAAIALRRLYPHFAPPKNNGKGRGFKAIMTEAAERGYVEVFSELLSDSIQYSFRILPAFHAAFGNREAAYTEEEKPAIIVKNIEKTLPKQHSTPYNTILWEQNLYAKMDTLKQLYDIIDDYVFTLRQAEDVSIKEVFAYCISLQKTEYQEQICRRTFNTLLGSNIFFTENNTPITKVYLPAIVAEIELFEDAENPIKAYISSQLAQLVGENLDETKLNLLFYGKTANVPEKAQ